MERSLWGTNNKNELAPHGSQLHSSAQHRGSCLLCEASDLDGPEVQLSHSESSSISHCSTTFSENEFNWDTELNRENELIPSLSAFLLSFTEL